LVAKTLVAIANCFPQQQPLTTKSVLHFAGLMIGEESTSTTKRLVQVDEGLKNG
jgi:hypothetical protein